MNRRNFLRGLGGIAVGLPLLEGLAPKRGNAAPPAPNKRLVVFFTCNGVNMAKFWPSIGYGPITSLDGCSLSPLAKYAGKITLPRGIHTVPRGFGWDMVPGDDHAKGMGHKLTASPLADATNKYSTGISVDQAAAKSLNAPGRSPLTLQVGYAGDDGLGVISYKDGGAPVKGELNPRTAFEDLMGVSGADDATKARLASKQKSILDLVQGDMDRLKRAPLSPADKQKLDMHFSFIRATEMAAGGVVSCTLPSDTVSAMKALDPTKLADDSQYKAVGQLHLDVLAIALACGHTRVGSILWGRGSGGPIFRWDGMSHVYNHHKLSHGTTLDFGGDAVAGYENMIADIDHWYAMQYAYLLDRLSSYDEGGASVLDNSVVVWANELSDGKAHDFRDMPWVLAGSAGGALKTGQYVKVTKQSSTLQDKDAPHNMLLTTVLNAVGAKDGSGNPYANFGTYGTPGEFTELKA